MMGFIREEKLDTYFYTVPAFSETGLVEHGFTCRLGGVSQGDFASFNLAFHVGDNPESVRKNRRKMVSLLGKDLDSLVAGEQVHSSHIHIVDVNDRGRGSASYDSSIPGTDALITNLPGIILSSYYADCVPVFFLDPINKVIALAHAGWKGTVQNIAGLTIQKMTALFGTDPSNCLAAIGPSIGKCCFQVDQPVLEEFARDIDQYERFCCSQGKGKWFLDLPGINEHLLVQHGLKHQNITQSGICTSCQHEIFYSYRKDQGKTGRQAALMMLRERSC
ncbi:MAG: peptidoglycan editing factor PgeF [Bacillota bacterium]|jgi:YfiH family protein